MASGLFALTNMIHTSSRDLSRLAVLTTFFSHGALMATWVSRIPAIQQKLDLSEAALGLTLLGTSAGMMFTLLLSGALVARFGSPNVTRAGIVLMAVTLSLLAWAPHPLLLWLLLFIYGGALSGTDVAMNEQAVFVQRKAGRPLMSSFHASYSLGGVAGALMGAGMASLPMITPLLHFIVASILFAGVTLALASHLLPANREEGVRKVSFRLPQRLLWPLGAVAFCTAIAEGAMNDWSAVYLTQLFESPAAFAALGFAAYSLTMTAGRLVGDRLTAVWTPAKIVRLGGTLAAFGFLAAILTSNPIVVLVGYGAIGLGVANAIPLAFSAGGNYPGMAAGTGIAGVATIGYSGFLIGPPLIGTVAEFTSLRIALALIMLLVGSTAFSARALDPSSDTPRAS